MPEALGNNSIFTKNFECKDCNSTISIHEDNLVKMLAIDRVLARGDYKGGKSPKFKRKPSSQSTKAIIRNGDKGKLFEVEKLIIHFYTLNKDRIAFLQGEVIIEGLVDMWNATLVQSLGVKPKDHPACFKLARWENGFYPVIYTCETTQRQTGSTYFGGVIGGDPVKPIVAPYFDADLLKSMQFEDTIEHFKRTYCGSHLKGRNCRRKDKNFRFWIEIPISQYG